jgi:AcrR family transcriptional regulator
MKREFSDPGAIACMREDWVVAGSGSPRQRHSAEDRRREILDAAVRLFSERGYRSTGIIALAAEVGITHSGLLHHFGTKEAILHAVANERVERDTAIYTEVFKDGGRRASARLPELGRHFLSDPMRTRMFSVLVAESLGESDPLHDYFVNRFQMGRTLLQFMLTTGIQRGEFHADIDPVLIAGEMQAFASGLETQWFLDRDDDRFMRTYEAYSAALASRICIPFVEG